MDTTAEFVQQVMQSKKYRAICEATVRDVLQQELGNHGTMKKAAPAAKERLHKLWAEFLGVPHYKKTGERLKDAFAQGDDNAVKTTCLEVLRVHASTAERIPLIENGYYEAIFARTGKPRVLADLACALNPFSFRWMGLERDVAYHAYDINRDFTDFVQLYFELEGLAPHVYWQDIYVDTPEMHFDMALIFKMFHCLEHRRKGAGLELLLRVNADWLAVSFPNMNLHGKKADIYGNYAARINETCAAQGWALETMSFANETLALIKKPA